MKNLLNLFQKKEDFFKKNRKKVDIRQKVFYILQNVKYLLGN